ncbi:uncharacterized protein HMPREF1541_05592 [Cyphellophora europaea CBS 101466]|uniref:Rhodopsin domain-containing protein n=1 Tax=Cyphellophora europaea (strain CBS 101466) TaxID=1220924 RepID=W2RUK3_CYPE1|nr:uncharacterized protein HMPREF1541_05592 [Cyphellophora europaea CBS 101466]ETN39369.1 hypothetical protein HMPREF1541_05592 [Cyphellophora europaea CBS 101466]
MNHIDSYNAKIANYVCSAVSLIILCGRLILTRHRDKKFDIASALTGTSILVLIVRVVVVYFYLYYGTSQDYFYSSTRDRFSSEDLSNIRTGSILALVSRFLITTFYWLQICLLLLFYGGMVREFHWVNTIKACWLAIVVTYITVVLVTFLECTPFRLYWQVDPNPGKCVRAYAQLLTQGTCNIVLDLFLLAISYPLIAVRKRTLSQKLRVGSLFILGFFCIIVTCLRIAYIYAEDSYQPVRSFWASVQMLVSTFVANVPTIYGCFQLNRRRKSAQRQRRASRPELWTSLDSPAASHSDVPQLPVLPERARTSESATRSSDDEKAWSRHIP